MASSTITSVTPVCSPEGSLQLCQVCKEPCANSCANCGKVFYCAKDHQLQDWKLHRTQCFPGTLAQDPVLGRHFVATRPILAGEVIIKEDAIISGPNGRSGIHPLCLVCYKQIQNVEIEICKNCHWPIHFQCQKDLVHCQYECQIFAKNHMSPFNRREVHMYEKVLVLRCLLLKHTKPSAWSKICDLQSHVQERHETHKGQLLSKSAVEFVHRVCQLTEFSDEEIDHVLGVLATNAFVTEDTLAFAQVRSGSYLFYNGSFPAHNCIPNGKWIINAKSKYVLRAMRNIGKGESITQLYGDSTVGTLERRQYLKDSKYFLCSCARCADPTELGSYFSGIKCLNCNSGYLVPANSLDETSDWKCLSEVSCPLTSVQGIETLLARITTEKRAIGEENSVSAVSKLKTLRRKYEFQLHANHYLIHEIEQEILQRSSHILASENKLLGISSKKDTAKMASKQEQQMNLAQRMVELSRKNLKLLEIISPGLSTHRGRQMYFLQQGLGILIAAKIDKCNENGTKAQIRQEIKEFLETRKLGAIILSAESELREEFILGKNMNDNETEFVQKICSIFKQ